MGPQLRMTDRTATEDLGNKTEGGGRPQRRLVVRFTSIVFLAPVILILGLFFFLPLAKVIITSVTDPVTGVANYTSTVQSPAVHVIMVMTFRIALLTTLACLVLAFPYAYYLTRCTKRRALILLALSTAPLWTIAIVRLYAWTIILGRHGLINETLMNLGLVDEPVDLLFNEVAVVVGMTHLLLPFMILILYVNLKGIDADLLVAASTLGASKRQAFIKVLLPLARPGIFTGSILVFIISLGFYITPAILGGGSTITVALYIQKLVSLFQWGKASAVSALLLAVTILFILLADRYLGVKKALFGGSRR